MNVAKLLKKALIKRRYLRGCSSLGQAMLEFSKARKVLKDYQAHYQNDEFVYFSVFLDEICRHLTAIDRIVYHRPATSLNDALKQIEEINETCQY